MLRYLYILPLGRWCALHSGASHGRCVASRQTHQPSSDRSFRPDAEIHPFVLFSARVTLFHGDAIWQVRRITPASSELGRRHRVNLGTTRPTQASARVEAQQFVDRSGYDVVDICASAIKLSVCVGSLVHNEKQLSGKHRNEHLSL